MVGQRWVIGLLAAVIGCGGTSTGSAGGGTDAGMSTDTGTVTDTGSTPTDSPGPADTGPVGTDAGAACGTTLGPCNPVTNAGCSGGMGCYVVAMGAAGHLVSMCLMAGTHGTGEACTSTNDCREGFGCLGMPGQCSKLCCGTDNTSCRDEAHGGQPGALCAGAVTGLDVRYCLSSATCDPYMLTGNGCPTATPICVEISRDGTTNCIAQAAGAGADGHGCCAASDCLPGYLCIGPAAADGGTCTMAAPTGTCRRVCNPMTATGDGGTSVCAMGTACGPLNGAAPSYGVCVPGM